MWKEKEGRRPRTEPSRVRGPCCFLPRAPEQITAGENEFSSSLRYDSDRVMTTVDRSRFAMLLVFSLSPVRPAIGSAVDYLAPLVGSGGRNAMGSWKRSTGDARWAWFSVQS